MLFIKINYYSLINLFFQNWSQIKHLTMDSSWKEKKVQRSLLCDSIWRLRQTVSDKSEMKRKVLIGRRNDLGWFCESHPWQNPRRTWQDPPVFGQAYGGGLYPSRRWPCRLAVAFDSDNVPSDLRRCMWFMCCDGSAFNFI